MSVKKRAGSTIGNKRNDSLSSISSTELDLDAIGDDES